MKLPGISVNKIGLIFLSCLLIFVFSASGQTNISTLKKRKKQNEKEIAYTNKLLKNTVRNKKSSLGQLNLLNQRIKSREALIQSIENEIGFIESQIMDVDNEVKNAKKELGKLKEHYAKMIVYAYKQRNSYEKLMFLLSSKDFNQAYKRFKYLQQFSEYSRKQGKVIVKKQEELTTKLAILNKSKKEKQLLLVSKTQEKNTLSREKDQQSNLVSELKKKERQLRNDLKKQKRYAQKLNKEIQKIIQRQAKLASKKKSGGKFALTPEEKVLSQSFGKNKGKLPWPTKTGFISEKFGEHPHPVLKHVTVRNDGVNITTDSNSVCRSIFKGEVTHILSMPGLNNVVIIRHGEFFSVYSNLASVNVKKGDLITAKEKIGIVFTDSAENQTVLKFQLWKGSTKLNPASWLYRN